MGNLFLDAVLCVLENDAHTASRRFLRLPFHDIERLVGLVHR